MALLPTTRVTKVATVVLFSTTTTTVPAITSSWINHQQKQRHRRIESQQYPQLQHPVDRNYGMYPSMIRRCCDCRKFHSISSPYLNPRSTSSNQVNQHITCFHETRLSMSSYDKDVGEADSTDQSSSLLSPMEQQQQQQQPQLTTTSTLTSEMLSLRFRDVFAHFRSLRQQPTSVSEATNNDSNQMTTIATAKLDSIPDDSTIRMNLLRTRHPGLELNKCRIDRSSIPNAGYGVYTTQSIQINELITLYPGDAILQWKGKDHLDPNEYGGIKIYFGTHIPASERTRAALNNNAIGSNSNSSSSSSGTNTAAIIFMNHIPTARSYEIRISDTLSVIGDPNRHTDPAYLGHMINDYCTVDDDDDNHSSSNNNENDTSNDDEMIRRYNVKSISASNCQIRIGRIDPCHVEIVATKPISVGEELFLSYGSNYWSSRRRVSTAITTANNNIPKMIQQQQQPTVSTTTGFASTREKGKTKKKR